MNRLRDDFQPEDWEIDPYDDTLAATERRAAHAAVNAELAAIAAAELYADRNVMDDDTLQPGYTIRKSGGGTRPRARRKSRGNVGRPTIGDEGRSIPGSVRMTPTTAQLVSHISQNCGGQNLSGTLEMIATLILAGDTDALLSLRSSYASG